MKEAMESCMQENHSGLLKPANPILSLLNQNLGAWQNLWGRNKREATEGLLQPTEEDF